MKPALAGLGFLWVGQKTPKNKTQKNFNDNYEKDRYPKGKASKNRSMMSGHSPVSHHEMFEFKDAHSTPPSTSKESSSAENALKSTIILDAADSVPTTEAYSAFSSRNNFKFIDGTLPCVNDKVPLAEHEELPNTSGTSEEVKDDSKLCEDDRPDGTWSQKDEKDAQSEEDLCIKCLYVSMQCCECSIM